LFSDRGRTDIYRQITVKPVSTMQTDDLRKELRATKRELLEEKHNKELEIISNKKELRRTKRKIRQVDEALKQI
jgi:ribosomal protein L29